MLFVKRTIKNGMIISSKNLVSGGELQSGANPCHSFLCALYHVKVLGLFILQYLNKISFSE